MSVFVKNSRFATAINGQDDYNNIFMPIESAIRKANVKKSEIDYVLLIGGSAQNPFIQEAIKGYFDDADILVPQDLQTHVSKGAAIHSLLMNGMNKCIIQPITSEPIFVITKDTTNKVLIPARQYLAILLLSMTLCLLRRNKKLSNSQFALAARIRCYSTSK